MDLASYHAYGERLVASLAARPEVLGVVASGSFASGPDEFSDHDFLVIVEPGTTAALRSDPSWLPDHERLVLRFPENEQGVKAVYDDAHLIEYTVLEPDEIGTLPLNRTRVLLDRADVTARIDAVVAGTPDIIAAHAESDEHLHGQLLTALLVGVQRHRRGEHLSGIEFVHRFALRHFLVLLARHVEAARPEARDNLNPFRRVELAYPEIGAELGRILGRGDLEETARGLLDLAAGTFDGVFDTDGPAWRVVRGYLAG